MAKTAQNILFSKKSFPCKSCGANLVFCADEDALVCNYCGAKNRITPPPLPIKEHDLNSALKNITIKKWSQEDPRQEIKCPSCAASFGVDFHTRSTTCPYCHTPIITNVDSVLPITPESLLPFAINKNEAKEIFKEWLGNLWFAPTSIKNIYDTDSTLEGIYLPYWTFDSMTTTRYSGMRGDVYHERVTRRVFINGREELIEDVVERIEWTPVSGTVKLHFDDVLVGASKSIPRKLIDSLSPWDLENLVSFDDRYLSGFESDSYDVALDEGVEIAQNYMHYQIEHAVRADIGGDRQQITDLKVYHNNNTYKHILLPIWSADFNHSGKTFRFAINARNGKIVGERPYSKVKIFFAILIALLMAAGLFYLYDQSQGDDGFSTNFNNFGSGGIHIEIRRSF